MSDEMTLLLNDFGPIIESKIDISKITVIGGENATGKSTTSKILYCFLRANSARRQEITYDRIIKLIKEKTDYLKRYLRNQEGCNIDFNVLKRRLTKYDIEAKNSNKSGLEVITEIFDEIKERIGDESISSESQNEVNETFEEIDNLIYIVEENDNPLYVSIMKKLLKEEFSTDDFNGYFEITGEYENSSFDFKIDFNNNDLSSDEVFDSDGWFSVNDIYYIDSFSILDLDQDLGLNNSEHAKFLNDNLKKEADESADLFDDQLNEKIIRLLEEIEDIINGKFVYENGELVYTPEKGGRCRMKNTASGVKQIGIIQLLLNNRKLKENSFLIIDEPEVNLHPAWQVKFAGVLALLVKNLNVSLYINSHSPIFIEALDAWAYYHDLSDYTKYYLSQSLEDKEGLNNIYEVKSDELYRIYDNLGHPYEDIDEIRVNKQYGL